MECASGSAVEHHLAKVGVAGSIPVSRSREGSGLSDVAVRSFLYARILKMHTLQYLVATY